MRKESLGLGFAITVVLFASLLVAPSLCDDLPSTPPEMDPTVVLTADPTAITADGSSTATITATVWEGEDWIWSGVTVEFSSDLGEITASAPILNGSATATLTAGTTAGVATIIAEATPHEDIGLLTNTTTVTFTSTEDGGNGGNGGGSSGGNGGTTSTPTPTVTTSPGTTPTPTSTSTETPSPTAGATAVPTVTPGATPEPATTATPAPAASATPTPEEPGFGAVFAIAGLLAVAYLLMWRRHE